MVIRKKGPAKQAAAPAKRVLTRAVKKQPAQSKPRVGAAPKKRSDSQELIITPFSSKGHYRTTAGWSRNPELVEAAKQATIDLYGSWDAVPFLKAGSPAFTTEKAIAAYVQEYTRHIQDGKSRTLAHRLAGQHSCLFDPNGRPVRRYADAAAAAKAALAGEAEAPPEKAAARARKTTSGPGRSVSGVIGSPFTGDTLSTTSAHTTIFERDPAAIDRGLAGHKTTLNKLGDAVRAAGFRPYRGKGTRTCDLTWHTSGGWYVAEVKSLTGQNETPQLRLGLGQVLDYRQAFVDAGKPVAGLVLAVEWEPTDSARWVEVCREAEVTLVWPKTMRKLLA